MDSLEFYKELYFKENERRMEVQNSMNIPIAVLTAVSSVIFYLISSMQYDSWGFLKVVFISFIGLAIISILFSIYFLIRAFGNFFAGYEYSAIPYVQQLYNWRNDLDVHFSNNSAQADSHFNKYLEKNLVKHTDHNMYVNDQKFSFIYRSKKFLVLAMVLTLCSAIPYIITKFSENPDQPTIQKIEGTNSISAIEQRLIEINCTIKNKNYEWQKPNTASTTSTTSTASR